ncbi:MAG: ABC transporter permease [Alphaproteobacteria bacterium]|nr:ABC transporter permease [Alphaproteobacteria bacterium]
MFANKPLIQCALFLVLLCAVFSFATPYFLSLDNMMSILSAGAVIGLLAVGATFVIAAGGIDLSCAGVMALASVVTAYALKNMGVTNPAVAFLLAGLTGAFIGGLTGALINVTRAPSFIITLGMMSIARALALILAGGIPIYGLAENITALGQGRVFGMPAAVLFLLGGFVLAGYLLGFTRFGRHILAFGDSAMAAHATGIRTNLLKLKTFALAGFFSGIAGFVFMARTNSGDPSAGMGYELMAITAVILGGANLFGGRAHLLGTFMGVLCLGVLQNGLTLLAISTFYQVLFVGIVLLLSAFLRRFSARAS